MTTRNRLTWFIAIVWFTNGFICKMLQIVPRHEAIVARILGSAHSRLLTFLIGCAEVVMGIWILSRFQKKLNAVVQIIAIVVMNTLEFILAPDLLLWGKFNALFAFLFILLIYYSEFILNRPLKEVI